MQCVKGEQLQGGICVYEEGLSLFGDGLGRSGLDGHISRLCSIFTARSV